MLRSAVVALGAGGGLTWGCILLDAPSASAQPAAMLPASLHSPSCQPHCGNAAHGHVRPHPGGRRAATGRSVTGRTGSTPAGRSAAPSPAQRRQAAGAPRAAPAAPAVAVPAATSQPAAGSQAFSLQPVAGSQAFSSQPAGSQALSLPVLDLRAGPGSSSGAVAAASSAPPGKAGGRHGSSRGAGRAVTAMSMTANRKGSSRSRSIRAVTTGGPGRAVPTSASKAQPRLAAPAGGGRLPLAVVGLPSLPAFPSSRTLRSLAPVSAWALDPFDLPSSLLPHGFGGQALTRAAKLKIPIALMVAMGLFLMAQALIDRRDPKVAQAPERPGDDSVGFE